MILVDTSVWIDHFRKSDQHLQFLLIDGEVACHTLIIGELVCGNLRNRKEIISLLQPLPMVQEINFKEYLYFVEKHNLFGKGIGYIDIHLLASAKLSQSKLWTLAKRLKSIALELGINYKKSR
ncbi:MAG: type II toxin-antitoxin system VapC family toxin [Desulfobacterales bacterium]|nr:type II toxin-antitoxin system VapC family toxin [Desulfobacterales bacterium]